MKWVLNSIIYPYKRNIDGKETQGEIHVKAKVDIGTRKPQAMEFLEVLEAQSNMK